MKHIKPILKKLNNQRGIAVIVMVVMIVALLGFVALAVDIGYALVTRNQIQNVADSAALAGARQVGQIYNGLTYEEQYNLGGVFDESQKALVRESAKEVALQNAAGGKYIVIDDADVQIGHWDTATRQLVTPTSTLWTDAVRVSARRDSTTNAPITTFFAGLFGINVVNVAAPATASLSSPTTVPPSSSDDTPPGGSPPPPLPIPVGISKAFFEGQSGRDVCGDTIKFHPTDTSSCAGWHNYDETKTGDSWIRKTLADLLAGTYETPEIKVNQTEFNFTGGTLSTNTFIAFDNLFQYMKTHDGDGKDDVWTAAVVVYDYDCGNVNQAKKIVGLATVEISEVGAAPNKEVYAKILCNYVSTPATPGGTPGDPSHGGGSIWTGTYASIPGLVE